MSRQMLGNITSIWQSKNMNMKAPMMCKAHKSNSKWMKEISQLPRYLENKKRMTSRNQLTVPNLDKTLNTTNNNNIISII
eukprot:9516336-Heterocapsa_arctica.AAC.1